MFAVELHMSTGYCKHFYNTIQWLRFAAYTCDLLSPDHVIYIHANIEIPGDSVLDDPVSLSFDGPLQFNQYLGSLLEPETEMLSALSAAVSTHGSPRP
jgi:hypothetical protein